MEIANAGIGAKVDTVEILGREKLLTLSHNNRIFKVLVENTFHIEEGKSQDKLNNKLEQLVKSKILTRYYFNSEDGKGIYIKPKVGKCYIFDEKTEEFIKKC